MNIVVLTGSPHKKGTSALLADEFIAGARDAGHAVTRFDSAFAAVGPCKGCEYCRSHDGRCVQDDAMSALYPGLAAADMVVFVTPLYYFGMTSQLKHVVDRFFAINGALRATPKKAALLATGGDKEAWAMEALTAHYRTMCRYLGWEDCGSVLALDAYTRQDMEQSDYPRQARKLGKTV